MSGPSFDLSPDAELLLDVMLEEFRKTMPDCDMEPGQFREAARYLLALNMVKIYRDGDEYSLRLTPEAEAMGALQ